MVATRRSASLKAEATEPSPAVANATTDKKRAAPSTDDAIERPAKKQPATSAKTVFAIGQQVTKDVTLVNQDGSVVRFADLYKDNGVVIFMYPRANTPGCTKQACGFRDHVQEIKDAGFAVYGMSGDSPKSLLNWKTKQELSYDLLSDPKHELTKYFGSSIGGSKVQRSHVIILKGGVVGDIQAKVSPAESVDRAVAFVNTHKQKAGAMPVAESTKATTTTSTPQDVGIKVGTKTTFDATLFTDEAKPVRFQELVRDRGVVFFMFPKADTPGCTVQACGFNDHIEEIKSAGFDVFGLSNDTPKELEAWKKKQNYQYGFLSDEKQVLIKFFGSCGNQGKTIRSHVIFLPGSVVGDVQLNITPHDSFTRALAFVKDHIVATK